MREILKNLTSSIEKIQELANLAVYTNFTIDGKIKKYFYIKTESGVIVRSMLPPENCTQFLVTSIALEMKRTGRLDFADVMGLV